jgi:hypothetical protein
MFSIRRIISNELQAGFDDLEGMFGSLAAPNAFVDNHNMSQPSEIFLSTDFRFNSTSGNISLIPHAAGGVNWYLVIPSILKFSGTQTGCENSDLTTGNPAAIVVGSVRTNDTGISNPIGRVTLGWSSNNGATWNPSYQLWRPLSLGSGSNPMLLSGTQKHYITGLTWPDPPSQILDREVVVTSALGGLGDRFGPSSGAILVGIFVDNNSIGVDGAVLEGYIKLTKRGN